LREDPALKPRIKKGEVDFTGLSIPELKRLMRVEAARYFLLAASKLNRTTLKKAAATPEAKILSAADRKSYAVQKHLPSRSKFEKVVEAAVLLRGADIGRRTQGGIEPTFRTSRPQFLRISGGHRIRTHRSLTSPVAAGPSVEAVSIP
jgi:hypothetical protein